MIVNKKAGRPFKYPTELLKKRVEEYREANPLDYNITPKKLSDATGIPHYIFRDNQDVALLIKSINSTSTLNQGTKVEEVIIPSAKDVVMENIDNPIKLIKHFQSLTDLVLKYQERACMADNVSKIEAEYKAKEAEWDIERAQKDARLEAFQRQIDLLMLESQSATKRREKGIAKNVLSIEKGSKEGIGLRESELLGGLVMLNNLDD